MCRLVTNIYYKIHSLGVVNNFFSPDLIFSRLTGFGPSRLTFSNASSTLFTNFSDSALLHQYILILWFPKPRDSKILFARSICFCAVKLPFLNWHSLGRHPTITTPSAPDFIAYNRCFTSILPVHRSLIIFMDGVYFKRATPAKSAAPYPHFKQTNVIILYLYSMFNSLLMVICLRS